MQQRTVDTAFVDALTILNPIKADKCSITHMGNEQKEMNVFGKEKCSIASLRKF